MYCEDCVNHDQSFDEDGSRIHCWRKNKLLTCLELEIARNVPPGAYGYCRGFIPIGCDAIVVLEGGD